MSAHEFNTEIETEILGELQAKIEFDYQPSEPMVANPDAPGFGPGCAEEFSVTSLEVLINDKWHQVLDLVPEFYHSELEDKCSEFFNAGDEC